MSNSHAFLEFPPPPFECLLSLLAHFCDIIPVPEFQDELRLNISGQNHLEGYCGNRQRCHGNIREVTQETVVAMETVIL